MTSFHASDASPGELRGILADHLALEEIRVFRQLLLGRCGLLALMLFVGARLIPGLSMYARWVPAVLCLVPPLWAWLAERHLERRLAGRVNDAGGHTARKS